jgi:hypothetical protein
MLAYYLEMEPTLFASAVEDQFKRLQEEKEARLAAQEAAESGSDSSSTDIALSSLTARIEAVKESEARANVEDLMYLCILEEFIKLGISMLPKMDNYTDIASASLTPLMEGVHSKEALQLVRSSDL